MLKKSWIEPNNMSSEKEFSKKNINGVLDQV